MKIIDTHAHIYPDKIAQKAAKSIGDFYHIDMDMDGTLTTLLQKGKAAGVSRFLVHSVAVTWERAGAINDFIARSVEAHPDKFIGFGSIHPDHPELDKELDRMLSLGLKGVKLHPDFQHFCLDDPAAIRLFEAMAERNLPLLVHTGAWPTPWTRCRPCGPSAPTWAAGACGARPGASWPAGRTCGWTAPPASTPWTRTWPPT